MSISVSSKLVDDGVRSIFVVFLLFLLWSNVSAWNETGKFCSEDGNGYKLAVFGSGNWILETNDGKGANGTYDKVDNKIRLIYSNGDYILGETGTTFGESANGAPRSFRWYNIGGIQLDQRWCK